MAGLDGRVEVDGFGVHGQRSAKVGLVKGVAEQDGRSDAGGKVFSTGGGEAGGEQAFARAVGGDDFGCNVDRRREAVAAGEEFGDGLAQLVGAADRGVFGVERGGIGDFVDDERGHGFARLAEGEIDRVGVAGREPFEQPSQAGEGRKDRAGREGGEAGRGGDRCQFIQQPWVGQLHFA